MSILWLATSLALAAAPAEPVGAVRATVGFPAGVGGSASWFGPGLQVEVGGGAFVIIHTAWARVGPAYVVNTVPRGGVTVLTPMLGYHLFMHAHDDAPEHGASASVALDHFLGSRGSLRLNLQGSAGLSVFPGMGWEVLPELRGAIGLGF